MRQNNRSAATPWNTRVRGAYFTGVAERPIALKMVLPAIAAMVTTLLAGCNTTPVYERPVMELPTAFNAQPEDWKRASGKVEAPISAISTLSATWWEAFNDPVLSALQNELSIGNLSLKVAEANYRQAQVVAEAAPRAFFPTLGVTADSTRSKSSSRNNSNSGSSGGSISTSSGLSFTTHWEADLWGGIRAQYEATKQAARASAADMAYIRLSLQAALANYYIQIRQADLQLKQLEEVRNAYRRMVEMTQARYQAGVIARMVVEEVREQLQAADVRYQDATIARAQYEHAIAVLLGKFPGQWKLEKAPGWTLTLPTLPKALPSTLLERRPDIAAAEHNVAIANANIGIAEAAYFPALTFDATIGSQGTGWAKWFSAPNAVWSFGPALALAILDSGRRHVQSEQAKAAHEGAVATYRQTVLTAFQEVEDNLVTLRTLGQENELHEKGLKSVEQRLKSMEQQVAAGILSPLDGVATRIALLNQQSILIDVHGRRLIATTEIIKALGGGWSTVPLQ